MTGYQMKRKLAAALCAVMMGSSMPFGALAEAIEIIAPQFEKIHASAEVSGTSITVHASGMSNPVIRAVLDGSDSRNMNGSRYTFENVAPGEHTVQVRYNAPDTGDYASNVVTVTVAAPVVEKIEPVQVEKIEPVIEKIEPVIEKIEPVIEKIEPVVEKIEPVIEKIEPVIEKIEPVIEKIEPVQIEKIEPVIEKIEPVVEKIEPVIEKIEPVQIEKIEPVQIERIEPVIEKIEPVQIEKIEPVIEKIEPVIEKIEPVIEKIEPVQIEKIEPVIEKIEPVIEKLEPVIEKIEPVIEKKEPVIEKLEAVAPTAKQETSEPVYSEIIAEVKTGADSITVTITQASGEAMYIAVGDDVRSGLHKGDSETFSGLPAGKYDVEVDYEEGTHVFRTSATIEAASSGGADAITPPTTGGGADAITPPTTGGGADAITPPTTGGAEAITPPTAGDTDEVKAFTILPVVTDGSIAVVIDGASSREIEVTLLDKDGKQVISSAIIGSGLVQLGKFASGTYTVRAQYVTPVQNADGSFDFKTVTAQASVSAGVDAPAQTKPVDIQAKVETGKDYIVITVTDAMEREMIVSVEGLGDRQIYKGNSTRYDGLTPGKTYAVEIDYVDYIEGAKKFAADVTIPAPVVKAAIAIGDVSAGENVLSIKGTAQAGEQILVQAEPAGAKSEVLLVGADGRFETKLSANPGTYTKVSAYYVTDAASLASKSGSWKVTAPAAAPSITIDPVNINSWTVAAKTGANLNAVLKTPDSTLKAASGSDGVVRFSLPHTYLKGDVFTLTVYYGANDSQSVSAKVTVGGIANYNDLEYGDYGDEVLRLTTRLAELGYPISPTRRYGSSVRRAVELFQAANGQEADGEAGDRMQAALYSVNAIPYGSGRYPTLVRGDKGLELIYKLQQRLKDLGYYTIKVDGIFGSGTQRAVREFQRVNGLSVTGAADNATQTLLYSSAAKPVYGTVDGDYKTLSRSGKYKSAVVPLQKRLKALGYYSGNIDGYFGSQTYRAVRNFQSRNGLTVTGVADPYTQQVLYSSSAKSYSGSSSSSSSTGYRLLYWGCRGDSVKRLQQALIDAGYKTLVRKADGIFGQWTYDAVRAYQKDHGLAVDGIAGKNTQNKLYGTNY